MKKIVAEKDLGEKETFAKWNGKFLDETSYDKVIKVTKKFIEIVKALRRRRMISKFTEVYYDNILQTIEIYTDGSRPTCPYLIVNPLSKKLIIDEMNAWEEDLERRCNTDHAEQYEEN